MLVIQDGPKKVIRCPLCRATTPVPKKGVDVIPQNVRLWHEAEIAMCEAKIKKEAPSKCGECCRVPALPTVSFCCACCMFLCQPCHEHHCISRKSMNHKILNLKDARKREISEELKHHIPPPPLHCEEHTDTEVKFYCTNCSSLVCIQCTVIQHAGHKFEEIKNYAQNQKHILNHTAQLMPDAITKLNESIANGKATTDKVGKRKAAVNDTIRNAFKELRKALDEREKALLAQISEISTSKLTHLQIQMQEMVSLRDEMISCCEAISEAQKNHTDIQLLSVVMVLQTRLQELLKKFSTMTPQLQDDTVATVVKTATLVSEIGTFGSVRKCRDYKSLNKPVMTISGVNAPYFVAIHDSGDIFITSCSYHCIRVFDKNGTRKAIIGSQGVGDGQFSSPLGITVSGDVMFVAENGGNRIQKLTVTGEFLMKFGTHGSKCGQMSSPWGMCLSSNGNVYVTDYSNSRIQVFDPSGNLSHIINGPELRGPEAIAFDPCGNLHVADYSSKCVNVFTVDGNYVRQYGNGLLQGPAGIAIDQDGYCLVGDWNRKSLCIFDPQGNFVHFVPTAGSTCGIALDKEGFIYVVDYGSNCVYKY